MTTRAVPATYTTIAAAVAAASTGDTIQIDTGVYTLADIDLSGHGVLTFEAAPGAVPILDWTEVDDGALLSPDSTLTLRNLTFIGADSGGTAPLVVDGADLTIEHCVFKGGYALSNVDDIVTANRCWFEGFFKSSGSNMLTFNAVYTSIFRSLRTSALVAVSSANDAKNNLLIDVWAQNAILSADECVGNIAVGCHAKTAIMGGTTSCQCNVAWECYATVEVFAAPQSNNHIIDPKLADIPSNQLYPVNDSPVNWMFSDTGVLVSDEDFDGNSISPSAAFQTPGAFAAVVVSVAEVVDATHLIVMLQGPASQDGWDEPWTAITFGPAGTDPAALVAARTAEVEVPDLGEGEIAYDSPLLKFAYYLNVEVWPELSAGATYKMVVAVPVTGGSTRDLECEFEVDSELTLDRIDPPPYATPEDFQRATARLIAAASQPPEVRLKFDYAPGDTVMWLTTTYKAPEAGQVEMDRIIYTYTAKTDGCLLGVASSDTPKRTYQAGEEVSILEHSAKLVS